jgi:hypothetical protein
MRCPAGKAPVVLPIKPQSDPWTRELQFGLSRYELLFSTCSPVPNRNAYSLDAVLLGIELIADFTGLNPTLGRNCALPAGEPGSYAGRFAKVA